MNLLFVDATINQSWTSKVFSSYQREIWTEFKKPEAATGYVLLIKVFFKIAQISQENTCVGVSF